MLSADSVAGMFQPSSTVCSSSAQPLRFPGILRQGHFAVVRLVARRADAVDLRDVPAVGLFVVPFGIGVGVRRDVLHALLVGAHRPRGSA